MHSFCRRTFLTRVAATIGAAAALPAPIAAGVLGAPAPSDRIATGRPRPLDWPGPARQRAGLRGGETMRIAWLGTGLMGDPMARRLLAAGHELAVWNRTAERTAPAVAAGARAAASPADATAGAELVFAMLRDGPVTAEVLLGGTPAPDLARRAVVQMATIAHDESRELAEAVRLFESEGVAGPP